MHACMHGVFLGNKWNNKSTSLGEPFNDLIEGSNFTRSFKNQSGSWGKIFITGSEVYKG
jgi:hypothetical protein